MTHPKQTNVPPKCKAFLQKLTAHPHYGSVMQFIKFGVVGVSNTLISLCVYMLCLHGLQLHYQLANVISFVVSVTNAYYWNSRYVFGNGAQHTLRQHLRAYGKAFLSYGVTFLLGTALLTLWVEGYGISESIAPVINLLITIPLNFVLNKFWAFRKKEGSAEAERTDA